MTLQSDKELESLEKEIRALKTIVNKTKDILECFSKTKEFDLGLLYDIIAEHERYELLCCMNDNNKLEEMITAYNLKIQQELDEKMEEYKKLYYIRRCLL